MSATVTFRQNRAKDKDGKVTDKPCSILVYYYNRGVEVEKSTGFSVPPANFTGSRVENVKLQKQINKVLSDIENGLLNIQFDHPAVTKEQEAIIATCIMKRQPVVLSQKKTVEQWITDFIPRAKVKKPTKGEYRAAFNHLKSYAAAKKFTLTWQALNIEFYNSFMEYLWAQPNIESDNTVGKIVKNVKKFISASFDEDQHENLNFKKRSFKVISAEIDKVYLNEAEIELFARADISSQPELLESKNRFVFNCWIGLRQSDLDKLGPNHYCRMLWGDAFKVTTQKTGEDVVVPLHPTAKQIWDSWQGVPPKKSKTYNEDIRTVAALAKIDQKVQCRTTKQGEVTIEWLPKYEMIHPHTARRSFATNCHLQGQLTKNIMAVTGHKSEKEFFKYICVTKEEFASIMHGFFNPKQNNETKMKTA